MCPLNRVSRSLSLSPPWEPGLSLEQHTISPVTCQEKEKEEEETEEEEEEEESKGGMKEEQGVGGC